MIYIYYYYIEKYIIIIMIKYLFPVIIFSLYV